MLPGKYVIVPHNTIAPANRQYILPNRYNANYSILSHRARGDIHFGDSRQNVIRSLFKLTCRRYRVKSEYLVPNCIKEFQFLESIAKGVKEHGSLQRKQ